MKEEFDKDCNEWYPIIDNKSEERQFAWRYDSLRISDLNPTDFIKEIKEKVAAILAENPGLQEDRIRLSASESVEEYEDYHYGYIEFMYYTPETDFEYSERLAELEEQKENELEVLKKLIKKYPDEAEKIKSGQLS